MRPTSRSPLIRWLLVLGCVLMVLATCVGCPVVDQDDGGSSGSVGTTTTLPPSSTPAPAGQGAAAVGPAAAPPTTSRPACGGAIDLATVVAPADRRPGLDRAQSLWHRLGDEPTPDAVLDQGGPLGGALGCYARVLHTDVGDLVYFERPVDATVETNAVFLPARSDAVGVAVFGDYVPLVEILARSGGLAGLDRRRVAGPSTFQIASTVDDACRLLIRPGLGTDHRVRIFSAAHTNLLLSVADRPMAPVEISQRSTGETVVRFADDREELVVVVLHPDGYHAEVQRDGGWSVHTAASADEPCRVEAVNRFIKETTSL